MTAFFVNAKINTIIARVWRCFMTMTGLRRIFLGKRKQDAVQKIELKIDDADHQDGLYVERIRIEKLKLRRTADKKESERNIYVKHFKNIPMADLEIVLPEKKNPGLTPMDWVKFLVSAAIGLVTVISSLSIPKANIKVIFGILTAVEYIFFS
ncbi:hypothetical protein SLEP1_g53876 [Rubroshorea leprosula]|uniref:Uncharacterized protein n=1 Tax=Rubroshorea leprosula TaxID=152421 RepID=A0AAV5MEK6_9ROSI|nr:hypothetical protein SLEP1_g53876 [Rubroshorea leprosula]